MSNPKPYVCVYLLYLKTWAWGPPLTPLLLIEFYLLCFYWWITLI